LAHAVHERTRELAELSHYLQRLQEAERSKIAREIHDELGGTLAAAKIDLRMLADALGPKHPQDARIARVMAGIDAAVQVKRRIIDDLRPTVLDSLGIGAALKRLCAQFAERLGIGCQIEIDDDLRLSTDYSTAFYRIVQEALTNTSKHAQAHHVVVSLRQHGNDWVLRVADDGVGIDVAASRSGMTHGVTSMRERARALGGKFSVRGEPGRGTVIEVRVPRELPEVGRQFAADPATASPK
jgi:signal transduction histidine kinase